MQLPDIPLIRPPTWPFASSVGNMLEWSGMALLSFAIPALISLLLAAAAAYLARRFRASRWIIAGLIILCPVAVLAAAYGLGKLVPTYAPARPAETTLRVAHLNSLFYSPNTEPKEFFAKTAQADVLSLVEANNQLTTRVKASGLYPYSMRPDAEAYPNHMPVTLFSRWPITRVEGWSPRLQLYKIAHPTKPFYVLQMHTKSPFPAFALPERNANLARINPADLPSPLIVVGDLNTVAWDPAIAPYRKHLTFHTSVAPTFPSILPMIAIDHLLTSPEITPASVTRVHVPQTDHLALVADFIW